LITRVVDNLRVDNLRGICGDKNNASLCGGGNAVCACVAAYVQIRPTPTVFTLPPSSTPFVAPIIFFFCRTSFGCECRSSRWVTWVVWRLQTSQPHSQMARRLFLRDADIVKGAANTREQTNEFGTLEPGLCLPPVVFIGPVSDPTSESRLRFVAAPRLRCQSFCFSFFFSFLCAASNHCVVPCATAAFAAVA
jgi:hypothetical protein